MRYFALAATLLLAAATGHGQCPFGLTNDQAPGQCGRYTDNDSNNICDLSQPAPEANAEAPSSVEPAPEPPRPEMTPAELEAACHPEGGFQAEENQASQVPDDSLNPSSQLTPPLPAQPGRPNYHPWLLMLLVWVFIIGSEFWQKKDPSKLMLVQATWNWLLLISFLASSLTGLYFILPLGLNLGPAMHYYHTIASLLFIYIALYHVVRRAVCLIRGPQTCLRGKPCR